MYNPDDTIAAIATAPGQAALAIVRMSGKDALNIAEKIFRGGQLIDRKASYGEIVNIQAQTLDEAVVIWYRGPRSYTGEDLVEIICHGGYVVPEQVLSLLCEHGARLAEPGEFTFRAFMNGRMDLTEAEAVGAVISSKTEKAKQLAINNLEGRLKERLDKISSQLVELITILEAEIDFADDEVPKLADERIIAKIKIIQDAIGELISTYDIGRVAEGRIQIVIVGAPNVGKSSLFNAILKSTRAIVTEIPGTTRDYLSEYVNIGGYPVIMTDTAGIRKANNEAEKAGIEKAKELIDSAELCLQVVDCSRGIQGEDIEIYNKIKGRQHIIIKNKIDLGESGNISNDKTFAKSKVLRISAKTGLGIEKLVEEIKRAIIHVDIAPLEGVLLSQRQHSCALAGQNSLKRAVELLQKGETEEIYISEIRNALDQISMITGKITSDDILNQIFTKFCIGK